MAIKAEDGAQRQAAAVLLKASARQKKDYDASRKVLKAAAVALGNRCRDSCAKFGSATVLDVRERVKDWDKLLPKLEDGRADPWDTCTDLIGIRIVVLSVADVAQAKGAVGSAGIVLEGTESTQRWSDHGPRAKGYEAVHMQIQIPDNIDVPANARKEGAELQIVTAMQDAWSILSHDDFYKSELGVPVTLAQRMRRLSAALSLADEELQALRAAVKELVESQYRTVQLAGKTEAMHAIELDETTLLAAAGFGLHNEFLALRRLGRQVGFRVSGWPELARPGFEADVFLLLAREVRIKNLGQLRDACRLALAEGPRLTKLADALERGRVVMLFDRPLVVLEAALTLKHAASITPPFSEEIMTAIQRIRADTLVSGDPKGASS